MPITPTYPGVYVQEAPSTTHTIAGVSTSVTAIIGYFERGPANTAVRVQNFGDFSRIFGGLDADSVASFAVQQYFLNGGAEAWVVRTASSTSSAPWSTASIVVNSAVTAGSPSFTVSASDPGSWGNDLRVTVDRSSGSSAHTFNLGVTLPASSGGLPIEMQWTGLSIDPSSERYAETVVNNTANCPIVLSVPSGAVLPAANGTLGGSLSSFDLSTFTGGSMTATLSTGPSGVVTVPSGTYTSLAQVAAVLQTALRAQSWMSSAEVYVFDDALIVVLTDPQYAGATLAFSDDGSASPPQTLASTLALGSNASENVQAYQPGVGSTGAQSSAISGGDGALPGADELVGSELGRTGMYALDAVDVINLLCIPRMAALDSNQATTVIDQATTYCAGRFAMLLVDPPSSIQTVQDMSAWATNNASLARDNNAVYWPPVVIADSLASYRARTLPPSGTLAGLFAKTDNDVGVWKAPAGVETQLRGVLSLSYKMTDAENGLLNPQAVNALRTLPTYGNVSWGARTLVGNDARGSQWKYIPVRRLAYYIELSLQIGLQWAVFQPNDEPLWSAIRLNVGTFMNGLYLKGAFQGQTPQEAYFVNCDSSTTSQQDIDAGRVNVVVGFAPLKPAEFVIITLQQMTGQATT